MNNRVQRCPNLASVIGPADRIEDGQKFKSPQAAPADSLRHVSRRIPGKVGTAARLSLDGQIKEAHRRLDALTAQLIPAEKPQRGGRSNMTWEILASLPGVGRIVLATLLAGPRHSDGSPTACSTSPALFERTFRRPARRPPWRQVSRGPRGPRRRRFSPEHPRIISMDRKRA